MDIWLEQSLSLQSTQYILSPYYLLPLVVDVERFLAAADWVYSHYDALHARVVQTPSGTPELVFDPAQAPKCTFRDLSGEKDPQDALQKAILQQARTPIWGFDLALARPVLFKTGTNAFCFLCTYHHILLDGWAAGIVFSRIAKVYDDMGQGREPQCEGGRFLDYVKACQESQDEQVLARAVKFWEPLLATPIPVLPPAHACEEGADEHAVAHVEVALARCLADEVTRQSATASATFFHAFLLAYGYLITTQYALESCAVAMPILNRSKDHKETIGMFTELRTMPLPLDVNVSIADNLTAIARRIREVYRYYRVPTATLNRLNQTQGNSGGLLAHGTVSYITQNYCTTIDGVTVPMIDVPPAHERAPFTLFVLDSYPGKDLRIELVYQRRHLNRDEAELFAQRLLHLLGQIAQGTAGKLSDLDLVPPAERRRIAAVLCRETEVRAPALPVIDTIIEQARKNPEAVAVEAGDRSYSYRVCLGKARAIAQSLVQSQGVQPGDRVALLLPRGVELIASQLAVMLAGGTFVPMEPHGPAARARQICEDAGAKCLVTISSLATEARNLHGAVLLADELAGSGEPFVSLARPDQIAYIIYTSGSTGRPKGVEISHQALAEHFASWLQTVKLRPGQERHLLFYSPAFDATIEAIMPALMLGGTLVVAPHPQWTVFEIARVIVARRLTVLYLPPAYLLEFLKYQQDHPGLLIGHTVRICMTGGDIMHAETAPLWKTVFGPTATLLNMYGPTEATVSTTAFALPLGYRAEPGESIPIGGTYSGRVLRIVDAHNRDVPIGADGELLIGGIGLARGYHNLPETTAERFVTLADGTRYYRSGDVVKLKSDGQIIYRRRLDQQVKIRGYRIELGEIEACLLTHPAVRECAVVVHRTASEADSVLRAYAALRENAGEDSNTLRDYLRTRLPDYMVPQIVLQTRLPKSDAHKIDRKALLALPVAAAPVRGPSRTPQLPQGPVQEYLALLWAQTLGTAVTDVQANFFAQGGHSLLAARLIAQIGRDFRVELQFSMFFTRPTLADTARELERLVGNKARLEKMAAIRLEIARMRPEEIKVRLEQARLKEA